MRRLGHIELGKHKVLDLCQRDDVIVVTLDGETVSTKIQHKEVKNVERGDIVFVENSIGIVNWVNKKQEINIFVNGEMQVFVFKNKCWIKLADYLRGAKYLRVALHHSSPKKSKKEKPAAKKKKDGDGASNVSLSNKESSSDTKNIGLSTAKGRALDKKKAEGVMKLRVHFLMLAHPSLSVELARKVVRKSLTLSEALKKSRQKNYSRPFRRPKIDFLDVPGLVVPGSYGTGKRR